MNASETTSTTSWISSLLLSGILGLCVLAGAIPAQGVTHVYSSPLSFKWTGASGPVDHYNVYLSVDGKPFERISQVNKTSLEVNVQDGRTYVLQIEAEDRLGHVGPLSEPSDQIAVFLTGSNKDTDGDGMKNAWEVSYGLNPFDAKDAEEDPDQDALANTEEFNAKTDPTDPDTDGDGIRDGNDPDPLRSKNELPVAVAGEDQVLDPTVVTLDGSGSYAPSGGRLTYSWTQRAGPEVKLSKAQQVSPSFLGKKEGKYGFELVAKKGRTASQPDEVVITIRNVRPSADAGPDHEGFVGSKVVLDGSGSADPNDDPLRFRWTQTAGTPVRLQDANSREAWFVSESAGVCTFQLSTSDDRLSSQPDEVHVIVDSPDKRVPTADAGLDRTGKLGETITLNGSGSSDPDGDSLSYAWSHVEGPETVGLQGAATVQPRFEARKPGRYRFRLVVNDGELSSVSDSVLVIVESQGNRGPIADVAYVAPVMVGEWVTLDGSRSRDPNRDPLTYGWSQTKGPQVGLENGFEAVAGFYAVTEGLLEFELEVDDGENVSFPAFVKVEVLPGDPNRTQPGAGSDGGSGGCSVGLGVSPQSKPSAADIGYVLTLFLPAIGAGWYWRRKCRPSATLR